MELSKVAINLKYLAPNGATLNTEERMHLQCALATLQCEMSFEELYLWGKIEGKLKQQNKLKLYEFIS